MCSNLFVIDIPIVYVLSYVFFLLIVKSYVFCYHSTTSFIRAVYQLICDILLLVQCRRLKFLPSFAVSLMHPFICCVCVYRVTCTYLSSTASVSLYLSCAVRTSSFYRLRCGTVAISYDFQHIVVVGVSYHLQLSHSHLIQCIVHSPCISFTILIKRFIQCVLYICLFLFKVACFRLHFDFNL